jgi:hypothetical protein
MGSRNSTTNTPITQMSMFSPYYTRSNARAAQRSMLPPLREGHYDPFVIEGSVQSQRENVGYRQTFYSSQTRMITKPLTNDMA